ncbi:chymotrypsinogen B-like protein [Dinothrombium tinctorium]|uniref:limulus clotting factor C n=1 Tax=Dinothrombium tinctorium TaxID=1965070 RepID=A0A3S3PL00_9ACAR|nr:chymotrypsinogen B-like protein [Dinothrombium tinctorium]RWS14719.1 chymotrypsinogen B-like protein [Dinothrombium tinctorium]
MQTLALLLKLSLLKLKIKGGIDNINCGVSYAKDIRSKLRIIGGREATKGRWPWQVAILNRLREPFCGGTLIAPQFVLTAAHCVRKRLFVRAGEHDLFKNEGTEQEVRVVEAFVHPKFDVETVDNDIALLRLRRPLKLGKYVSTACLPSSSDHLKMNTMGIILGWGKKRNSALFGTDVLHQAQVPIADLTQCRLVYQDYYISDNMICAGFESGRVDTCAGDSGGPLLFSKNGKWHVFGITSFGEGCGRRGKYGIYAKVVNYVKWIRKTVRKSVKLQLWKKRRKYD